jgi:hypothetical protein
MRLASRSTGLAFAVAALLALAVSSPLAAQGSPTVDQVIDKYVQAVGGKVAMEKLTSRQAVGTIDPGNGMTLNIEIHEKAPNKFLSEVTVPNFGSVKQGFDGSVAWDSNPQQGVQELSGAMLASRKRNAQFYRWLRLRELFPKLELKGAAKVGDRDAYFVEATPAEGAPEKFYFDTQTGLLLRRDTSVDTPDGTITFESYYEDYREVDGVKIAFSLRRVGPDNVLTLKFTEVKHNVPFDDAQFAKPATP